MTLTGTKHFLAVLLAFALAACAAPQPADDDTSSDPEQGQDVTLPETSPEASGILALLNDTGTDFTLLDETVGLDRRAAGNLIAHRDGADTLAATGDDDLFETLAEVDAIAFVGPAAVEALRSFVEHEGWATHASGNWEGVSFSAAQVSLALDLAGNADLERLDDTIGLDARAAENIIAARPIASMNQLAAIGFVGTASLEKIRGHLPAWQEYQGSTLEVYDGVAFTHVEAARALLAAKEANFDALSSVGIYGAQANTIIAGRPWDSLAEVAATPGIGPLTMKRLRTLGEGWADATMYVVKSSDLPSLVGATRTFVLDGDSWMEGMQDLLSNGDLSGDADWVYATTVLVRDAILARLDAFAATEVGRSYSSKDAAQTAMIDYVKGQQAAAFDGYPAGVLSFVPAMPEAKRLARMKTALLHYWQNELVYSAQWQATFDGRTWAQVANAVTADVNGFEHHDQFALYQQTNETIFVGRVYGLYIESNVDAVGKVTRIYVEID